MKKRILWIAVDLTIAAMIVLAEWIAGYKLPQKGIRAAAFPQAVNERVSERDTSTDQEISAEAEETETQSDSLQRTSVFTDTQDWHQKFADKFTDTVIATDTSYSSPDLSIQLSYQHYDTGKMDLSEAGKHKEYGTQVSYVLADIYVGDITCFRTAFAQDTYGVGYSEKLSDMETCVLNWDGTMDIYSPDQIDLQKLVERGAYQSWIFGPSLLDENGRAKPTASLLTWSYIKESHPRTAIGYFEPGHYCILLADGRQKTSRGMFPGEMAKVFEDLGCRAAYNLDGGHSSFMTFQGQTANHPYQSEEEVTDGIFFKERL